MSESVATQAKPKSTHGGAASERAIAQVEKWMEMIREINREQSKN